MKYTNVDMKHLIKKPVYVPWAFLAGLFGLITICLVAVAFLIVSPDDLRYYEVGRFCIYAALPFSLLATYCAFHPEVNK